MSSDKTNDSVQFSDNNNTVTTNVMTTPQRVDLKKPDSKQAHGLEPWQKPISLRNGFNPWANFLHVCNVVVKVGSYASFSLDALPSVNFLTDKVINGIYRSPYVIGDKVEDVLEDLHIPLGKKRKKFKQAKKEIASVPCMPIVADSVIPTKVDTLTP